MVRRDMLGPIVAAIVGAAVLVGCGDDGAADSTASAAPDSGIAGGRVYSQAAQLSAGSKEGLLTTPEANVTGTCKASGDGMVTVEGKGATSYAVVASHEGDLLQPKLDPGEWVGVPIESPDIQTWTISPFAKAGVQPTLITVSFSDPEPSSSVYDCAVFATAVVGQPGSTLTK